jgi:peptide/nickel transport system substrate-binding protein
MMFYGGSRGRYLRGFVVVMLSATIAGSAAAGTENRSALPVLRIGLTTDIPNLNSALAASATAGQAEAADLAYDGLFHMTPSRKITASLATKWHYFTTGRGSFKDFEFTLRRNAKYSDGTPVTASTVVAWFNYFETNNVAYLGLLGPKPTFKAVGKYTVRMHLTAPNPDLPALLSDDGFNWGFPASPKAIANPTSMALGSDGAGPYMLDSNQSVRGDHYTYVPNPYYYNKSAVKFSQVYIKIISTPSSMLSALQTGQLDVAYGDTSTAAAAQSAGFKVAWAPAGVSALAFNVNLNPALKDVRVRQAINYAIDRKTVTSAVLGSYGTPTSEFITSDADPGLQKYYSYNPAKAKSLLAAAGHPNGFTLKIITVSNLGAISDPLIEAAAKYLDAVGIHPDITAETVVAWGKDRINYPAYFVTESINTTATRYGLYIGPGTFAATWGSDPAVYKLYYAGFKTPDPSVDWKKMWARVTKQAYFLPISAYPVLFYYSPSITGVTVTTGRVGTPLFTEFGKKK